MRTRPQSIWKDYLGSLAIAYGIAILFTLAMPSRMGPDKMAMPLQMRLLMPLISGTFFGNAFFFIGFALPRARFRSFLLTCLVRSLIICLTMVVGLLVIVPVSMAMFADKPVAPWHPEVLAAFRSHFPVSAILTWSFVGLTISMTINAIHQVNRKLGPGIALNWLTGKYHTPREEERIFMFLDLKHSTTLAEKLGNIRFSKLCQDFFHDLTAPVTATKGEVSHYIGDEAVLTWKPKKGLEKANCIRCFQFMEEVIAKRADYYRKQYGIVPGFKAGVHIGPVVAAEVGDIKSEIVYHGDVLNTTARITGLCSEMGSDLLISGDLNKRIELPAGLSGISMGLRLLKGKEHEVEIVAIREDGSEADQSAEPQREVVST